MIERVVELSHSLASHLRKPACGNEAISIYVRADPGRARSLELLKGPGEHALAFVGSLTQYRKS